MGEVSFPGLGARLPSAAVNSAILEAYVIPGYEKPTDQEEAILDFLKGRDVFVYHPLRHSSLRLAAFLQLGKARSTHVLVTTFSFCNSKPDRTLGKGENLRTTLYSPAKRRICHAAGTHSTAWHFHLARTNFTPRCSHQCYVIRTWIM